jgi:hypothetical protein
MCRSVVREGHAQTLSGSWFHAGYRASARRYHPPTGGTLVNVAGVVGDPAQPDRILSREAATGLAPAAAALGTNTGGEARRWPRRHVRRRAVRRAVRLAGRRARRRAGLRAGRRTGSQAIWRA